APQEIERRLADRRAEERRQPVVLDLPPSKPLAICDEPSWDFRFTLTRKPDDRVGFPVFWIDPPAKDYGETDPAKLGRQVQPGLGKETSVVTPFRFTLPARPAGPPAEVVANVLYRGQPYR